MKKNRQLLAETTPERNTKEHKRLETHSVEIWEPKSLSERQESNTSQFVSSKYDSLDLMMKGMYEKIVNMLKESFSKEAIEYTHLKSFVYGKDEFFADLETAQNIHEDLLECFNKIDCIANDLNQGITLVALPDFINDLIGVMRLSEFSYLRNRELKETMMLSVNLGIQYSNVVNSSFSRELERGVNIYIHAQSGGLARGKQMREEENKPDPDVYIQEFITASRRGSKKSKTALCNQIAGKHKVSKQTVLKYVKNLKEYINYNNQT